MAAIIITSGFNSAVWAIRRERAAQENRPVMAINWGDCFRAALRNSKKETWVMINVGDVIESVKKGGPRMTIIAVTETTITADNGCTETIARIMEMVDRKVIKIVKAGETAEPVVAAPAKKRTTAEMLESLATDMIANRKSYTAWERGFISSNSDRLAKYGDKTMFSGKVPGIIADMYAAHN